MADIEIEIDGKKLQTQSDKMIIQVADEAGIYIPRFCYHKHLSIAANCRMCLVEVEKSPKTLPACATPVMPGMKVMTRSSKALAAQRAVMEFLLINHPLDCPICDQGGECELQDLSLGYGRADSYYVEGKRSVKDENLGPLVATEMTRCIQCSRCIRFGQEIAGMPELGFANRGELAEVRSFVAHTALHSEVSGNIIDLCPVGALTSKPFRFTARAWELQQYPSIAPHDCLGSHIYVHTRQGEVMRVVPRENPAINQVWLSDRDRFSYEGLYHEDRLTKPLVRKQGRWQETDWQTALQVAAESIKKVITQHGSNAIGALASPNSTVEEFYLLQKMMRALGSGNIDHRLRQVDFFAPEKASLSVAALADCDAVVLIGSNLQKEQPIAALHLRKAIAKGANVISLNMMDYDFNFKVTTKKIAAPHLFLSLLQQADLASALQAKQKIAIVVGALAQNHPQANDIIQAAKKMAATHNASLWVMSEGANASGAFLAGMVPNADGLNAQTMLAQPRKSYLLLNVEPNLDCANPVLATHALEQAESVIAFSLYKNSVLNETAHVIFPIALFTETSGTYVNVSGEWQSFTGVAAPFVEARPAWKVLRVLANLLHCEGFDYTTSEQVREEAQKNPYTYEAKDSNQSAASYSAGSFTRVGEIPIYATDSLTRHAKSLQETQGLVEGQVAAARLHPTIAEKLNLKEGARVHIKQNNERITLPIVLDARLPLEAVGISGGIPATSGLPELFGIVEIEKA